MRKRQQNVRIMANGVFYSINLAFKGSFIFRITGTAAKASEDSKKTGRRSTTKLCAGAVP
jgi:hypothetical protein